MNSQFFGDAAPPTTGAAGSGAGQRAASGNVTGPIKGSPWRSFDTATEGFQLNVYHDDATSGRPTSATRRRDATPTLTLRFERGQPRSGIAQGGGAVHGRQPVRRHPEEHSAPAAAGLARARRCTSASRSRRGDFHGRRAGLRHHVPAATSSAATFTNFAKNNNWQEFTVNLDSPMTPTRRLRSDAGHHRRRAAEHRQRGRAADAVTFNIDSFSIDPPIAGGRTRGRAAAGGGGAAGGDRRGGRRQRRRVGRKLAASRSRDPSP